MDHNKLLDDVINILNHFKRSLFEFLPNIVGALFIFVVGLLFARLVRFLVIRFINKLYRLIPNQNISRRVSYELFRTGNLTGRCA